MPDKILVAAATRMEIVELLESSGAEKKREKLDGGLTRVSINGVDCFAGITGIGVVNTASLLTRYIEKIHPDLIIQMGIAGAFPLSGLDIGDVAVADREVYIHAGVENPDSAYPLDPLPFALVEGLDQTCRGIFYPDPPLSERSHKAVEKAFSGAGIKVEKGPFITVSTISASRETERLLYNLFSPLAESMEGAAAAQTANLYRIPFVEIRAFSNFVGVRDRKKWNISEACRNVSSACEQVIGTLARQAD